MKNRFILFAIISIITISLMCACSGGADDRTAGTGDITGNATGTAYTPEISQIREICELATLECYYHNVAKSTKEKESGLLHIGEKDRTFWIEYSGSAKFGIDMSKVNMTVKGDQITITLPEAKLLGLSDYVFTPDNYIASDDGINKNPITAENQTEAIANANAQIEELFSNNETLLIRAQDRAKMLIENYINQLGSLSGIQYHITWEYENSAPDPGLSAQ